MTLDSVKKQKLISVIYLLLMISGMAVGQTCPEGSYLSGNLCLPCMPNCKTCSSGTACTKCKQGFSVVPPGTACVSCLGFGIAPDDLIKCDTCGLNGCTLAMDGYAVQADMKTFITCPEYCKRCQNSSSCTECHHHAYAHPNYICLPCPGMCFDCRTSTCGRCSSGYRPQTWYCEACTGRYNGVATCTTSGSLATSCAEGYRLDGNSCTWCSEINAATCNISASLTCKSGNALNGTTCSIICGPNAHTCNASTTFSCKAGYSLSGGVCVQDITSCPAGEYLSAYNTCSKCQFPQLKCSAEDGQLGSITCASGYYLHQGRCRQNSIEDCLHQIDPGYCKTCDIGFILSNSFSVCSNCGSTVKGKNECSWPEYCVTNSCYYCPRATFKEVEYGFCMRCDPKASACYSTTIATACIDGYYLDLNNQCQPCASSKCKTCRPGPSMTCEGGCAAGHFDIGGTKLCDGLCADTRCNKCNDAGPASCSLCTYPHTLENGRCKEYVEDSSSSGGPSEDESKAKVSGGVIAGAAVGSLVFLVVIIVVVKKACTKAVVTAAQTTIQPSNVSQIEGNKLNDNQQPEQKTSSPREQKIEDKPPAKQEELKPEPPKPEPPKPAPQVTTTTYIITQPAPNMMPGQQMGMIPAQPPIMQGGQPLQIQQGFGGNQQLPRGFAGNQQLPPGFGGNQQLPPGFGGNQQLPPGFGGNQQLPPGFAGYQQLPPGFSGNNQLPSGFGGGQQPSPGYSYGGMNNNLPQGFGSNSNALPPGFGQSNPTGVNPIQVQPRFSAPPSF
jgi:hypothetical protein